MKVELLSFSPIEEALPIDRMGGLFPEVWVSVGAGFSREEVKALVLSQGQGFIGETITTLQELCLQITDLPSDQMLTSSSRQEVLQEILKKIFSRREPSSQAFLEIRQLKRQRGFIRKLDRALQSGRLAFAHAQEEEVYAERLEQHLGKNRIRSEIQSIAIAYETWLEASQRYDLPLLIRRATEILREGWPVTPKINRPLEVWVLSIQAPESLEREFWDVLSHFVQVHWVRDLKLNQGQKIHPDTSAKLPPVSWLKWHTLDDAAQDLADQLAALPDSKGWMDHAVLIPDIPSVRRSLTRALESRGVLLSEPRDPSRLRWDESLKWGLLPLQVVGSGFERETVISWLKISFKERFNEEFLKWAVEINGRGIRNGYLSYSGGVLSDAQGHLSELQSLFGGRKTFQEISQNHLLLLKKKALGTKEAHWLISLFEQIWKSIGTDRETLGFSNQKAPLLFWLEKLQERIAEASPPIEPLKPTHGVAIYRLQQAPVRTFQNLWILGLPSGWLTAEGTGNYWYTEREREVLSAEFSVRSAIQLREERIQALKSWISGSQNVQILDAAYDFTGREKESIFPVLEEVLGRDFSGVWEDRGAHRRFLGSYSLFRPLQAQEVFLPQRRTSIEVSASTLDRYSRCSFQALAYHRWNLSDLRQPDLDLWPDARGTLLHEAVRILMKSLNPDSQFLLNPKEAIDRAWNAKRPKGLIRNRRVENYVKSRLVPVLELFCEKEREYLDKSESRALSLDETRLSIDYPHFTLFGKPDRIDENKNGLFIIDYKTSGTLPHGSEMLNNGYRLQLPFYAIAAARNYRKPVVGLQFIELDRKGGRSRGIFFKPYNGKSKGSFTSARSNSKSLVEIDPLDAWSLLEERILVDAQNFLNGQFKAMPRIDQREKECARCSVADLCGFRRITDDTTRRGLT